MSSISKAVDPVLVARSRLGMAARGHLPELSVEQARKELAIAKLTRHISEVIEEHSLDDTEVASLCQRLSA